MIDQEALHDLTESYLQSVISQVSDSLGSGFDSLAAFGELGINSFQVLKILKKLEHDFGTLPKSLLFEAFNVHDLARYFAKNHETTLRTKFAGGAQVQKLAPAVAREERRPDVRDERRPAAPSATAAIAAPVAIREKDALARPDLRDLVRDLYAKHKIEGSVSRGTRVIAPNLFIGSTRRGYFHYARAKGIIVVYGYTGPAEYLPLLLEEIDRYSTANDCQLNVLTDEPIAAIDGKAFSATPFGVLSRVTGLKDFSLDGGAMRRLRYLVSKFQKTGVCRTEEYRCGSNPETDGQIANLVDLWCESRTVVNPLVHEVKADILAGALDAEHRVFVTYLDGVMQNAILITSMSGALNGYLMDLEFYRPDMPLGGLELTIVEIIAKLAAEGCDMLSLGGTYGCRIESSPTADPDVEKVLDELRDQNIFNDAGNLQFKNKFRPDSRNIYLCRAAGSGKADNVIDIIMMIADPHATQTPEPEMPASALPIEPAPIARPIVTAAPRVEPAPSVPSPMPVEGGDRARLLADAGFDPLDLAHEHVDFDLKTDSWAQLHMPVIGAQMRHLHSQLQQPASVDEALRAVFPFAHLVLTSSGQAAESIFFKAWPKKGVVPQNLLFPSTIFHQIDNDFTPLEMPHPAIFQLHSSEPFKGNLDLRALEAELARDAASIACVCIEVGDNASGGHPVSTQHLREVKAILGRHAIPLVIDATRVVQNAQLLIEREQEHAGKSVWAVVREILSHADVVIGSLTKELCVDKGGIVACNDAALHGRLLELLDEESAGLDFIEKKLIALSLQNRKYLETRVARKIEHARRIGRALSERGVPVAHIDGGHCVLIDVRAIREFGDLEARVPSFVAWLYLATGIRAAAHSVGMQRGTSLNELVRLAVPAGLKSEEVDALIERLNDAFTRIANVPELAIESSTPRAMGGVDVRYRLERYRNVPAAPSRATTNSDELHADSAPRRRNVDIAIVGMAGRYPKAKNVRELWQNLVRGVDAIEEIPAERLERRLQYGNAAKYRGGFIDDVDRFDSLFFNISPREAEMIDPQERLFLEVAWEVIEDAGYYPEILAREGAPRNIGVFVGAVWAMYQMVGIDEQYAGNKISPNSFLWSIANRVSYWMNLSGPSLTVDTACSSSLTALYLACEAIQSGECSAAIVGGVNLDLHQAKLDINLVGGALSPDGVCRTFGKGANGYVGGEGVGAVLLKPLDQAEADGDHIYGVVRGAVVNHGGRTSGYFVPNPAAQSSVIQAALDKARVSAQSIGYVEAHGTGTELGDPIEITGLTTAFSSHDVPTQTCAVGSIKTNIGHLEAAAGVVGVTKILLQMQHRQLVPSLHSEEKNPFIDFARSPFYVVQQTEEWKAKELDGVRLPLRAGISSFGAGGANAHVILESYEPRERTTESYSTDLIFPLSARNEEQLRATANRLAQFLRDHDVDLNDAAYTLQHGRKSFEHRLAIIARSKDELIDKLARFVDGRKGDDIAAGHVKVAENVTRLLNRREKQEFVRMLSQARDPHKIASLWTEGLLDDWQGFPSDSTARRTSLPTYPFAGKRHWVGEPAAVRRALQPVAGIHPMIDSNESTFERQLFRKTFHDRDFFIHDHLVSDVPTLPGVAYLELARKAGELAAGRPVRRIQNILWVSPIAVRNAPQEVFIELKPAGEAVQFEVFSESDGKKTLHSQGKLLYTNRHDDEPAFVDLDAIRGRCTKRVDGKDTYPVFKSVGLTLGPSFQVLQEVHKNDDEALGRLSLPESRRADLHELLLHPSLVDGSLQTGMAARLTDGGSEMLVPYSIGEVEILAPIPANCFSYTTEAKDGKRDSRVRRSNVLILDETGKVVARIRESTGVPLMEVHKKADADDEAFSTLYYAYDWEHADLIVGDADRHESRTLLLFDADTTLRDAYRERTSARVILVQAGSSFRQIDDVTFEIDAENGADFTRLLETLADVDDLCFAWAGERAAFSFLMLCQALVKAKLESRVQLLHFSAGDEALPFAEAITGFINTLRNEHSKLVCRTLDIRQGTASLDEIVDVLRAELRVRTQDAVAVRYESRQRSVRKLKAFDLAPSTSSSPLRDRGVYLITGGAGGLGLIFAEFLAKECHARLVLTGRSALSAKQEAKLDALRELGGEVLYVAADVSKRDDVGALFDEIEARFGEIHGVIHAAGVVRDSLIRNKTVDEMSAVFAPKIQGTMLLDEATKNAPLDFFVLFSSLAAVAGNPGQADYSYANSFMDAFAAERERLRIAGARSGRSLSINWALWADGGMRPDEQTELAMRKTLGMKALSSAAGIDAFVRGLASSRSQIAVVEGVQEKLELVWGLRKKAPVAAPAPSIHAAAAPVVQGDGVLREWLQNELAQIAMRLLKLDASDVDPDKILLDLGFDSIGLTTFANAINDRLQLDITPILFFDHPSMTDITKNLVEERKDDLLRVHGGSAPATPVIATPAEVAIETPAFEMRKAWNPAHLDHEPAAPAFIGTGSIERRFEERPIAIVGMSGVMPQSEDLEEFWENLKNSRDLVTLVPPDRWRWEDYYGDPLTEPNKTSSKWGAFMREVDKFDPLFFGISPREAQTMDPQQRIFLEQVWKAVEDSGHKISELSGTKTGVFVGVATNDYVDVMNVSGVALDGYSASGNSHSVLANRVSFLLGLRGPSAPLDTACSSSLVALHRALESIHTGSCDMAIVGGVQVMLTPAAFISFSSAGMLSPDGKCKTFDKSANGYVRGEGCGAIFLKSLAAAEADGDHIYAVVKATAENHGGRVTAMTAPNPAAQAELLIEAYEKGRVDPATVGFIECHGTGTSLGDPIEIQALSKAFAELYKRRGKKSAAPHIGLSSVKTNIGHLETAAGIAGILKTLLAIKHKQIPANLHLQEVNPYINLDKTPFYIADKLTPWSAPVGEDGVSLPRRAGISSFGFGGANAHIVLTEHIAPKRAAMSAPEPQLIVLSAKNGDRLSAYAELLRAYVEKSDVELSDLAYTLQVGRDEMPDRLALVVADLDDLRRKLQQIVAGNMPSDAYRHSIGNKPSTASADESLVKALIEARELAKLAELWVTGVRIDWRPLHKPGVARVSAPTYPFARERYWFQVEEKKVVDANLAATVVTESRLHPLVHRNVSTFDEQKFAARFTGDEFFFADHVIGTQKTLPGVAYLEMARVAGEMAAGRQVRVIRNLTWERPLVVGNDAKDAEIALVPGRNEVAFAISTAVGGGSITHCNGRLGYTTDDSAPVRLDIARIRERCHEQVVSRDDLYPFLSSAGLNLGRSFQIVEKIFANESEALAVLVLPEHLRGEADQYWLHPALMDGSLHTAIGLLRANGLDARMGLPYSVSEIQIVHPLRDLYYGYATWTFDPNVGVNGQKVTFHLLDKDGTVLVRLKDFTTKPLVQTASPAIARSSEHAVEQPHEVESDQGELKAMLPVWNPIELDVPVAAPSNILLLGGSRTQLDWLRVDQPNAQLIELEAAASVEAIAEKLEGRSFDQLVWMAPDIARENAGDESSESFIEQQERGVMSVFRIVKALLQSGYANKSIQWTLLTRGTQRVTPLDSIEPAHAAIVGLVGSLAKECPHWRLRLLDIDSLDEVSARECLTMPFDAQGDALAHRYGEWFRQGLAVVTSLPEGHDAYRENGVYVVIGGAGGLGETWSRAMIEQHRANMVWIGRREYDAEIEAKINALAELGPAPLYITADASDPVDLARARRIVLDLHPAIHGVVHSAIVLRDQSLARMDESAFRASLSAKVDVSVNMDRVFGNDALDFLLFFSSIVSIMKTPGQSNYAAGCTFKDSFAHWLEQQRPYPVKVMNWGYWGSVGVAADESHNRMMRQVGIGSITPQEGWPALQSLIGANLHQLVLLKTLNEQITAALGLTEAVTYHAKAATKVVPPTQLVPAG